MPQDRETNSNIHQDLARSILSDRGEVLVAFDHIGRGSTAEVYHLQTEHTDYALRIGTDNSRDITPVMDANIRQCLFERGATVAKPYAHAAAEYSDNLFWSLDQYCKGFHPDRGKITSEICREIGRNLAVIHSQKTSGVGRPLGIENETIQGDHNSLLDAVLLHFDHPVPDFWEAGFKHPMFEIAPELDVPVRNSLKNVVEASRAEKPVLCHSDLHEKQFICSGDSLVAIIDFGKASILNRYWDLGSFLYFHGEQQLQWLLDTYGQDHNDQKLSEPMIKAHAISIAMHHAMRSRISGKEHRLTFALSRVKSLLKE